MSSELQPYDITQIPSFPYAPGLLAWVLCVALLVCLYVFLARRGSGRSRSAVAPGKLACSELTRITADKSGQLTKDDLSRASAIARRFAAHQSLMPVTQWSTTELRRYAASLPVSALRSLLEDVAAVEELKYQPAHTPRPGSELIRRMTSLIEQISASGQS